MLLEKVAWLILRIAFAWMYLYPIIALLQDRQALVATTQLLFKWQPTFFAYASIGVMIVGALSILFGIYAQVGGFLLLIFTVGGTVIHYRLAAIAAERLLGQGEEDMAKLALVGHVSSAQKNIVLIAVACFFFLLGSGPLSLTTNLWNF